jgi:hypothetical protein
MSGGTQEPATSCGSGDVSERGIKRARAREILKKAKR